MARSFASLTKAFVMDKLTRAGFSGLVVKYWSMKGERVDYLQGTSAERFDAIYKNRIWALDGQESLSGNGSSIPATATIRAELPALLKKLDVGVLLDLGCGDFHWMKDCELQCHYIGADIVPSVIEKDKDLYGVPNREFIVLDASTQALPKADAVLCREVLFHLSFSDTRALMKNVARSGAKYFISTSDPTVTFNADIPTGSVRDINLVRRPYKLGEPLYILADGLGDNPHRVLGVWPVSALPA